MYESKKSEMYDMADVPTYEEVTSYHRPAGAKHRLLVFVGENKVGLERHHHHLSLSSRMFDPHLQQTCGRLTCHM